MAETADVVVVGAGVVGGAIGYLLAREGLRVCLLDKEAIGSGASGHGHGVISLVGKDFRPGAHFELGLAAARGYPRFVDMVSDDSGIDPLYHELPGLSLALVQEEEQIFKDALEHHEEHVEMRWLGAEECLELEPRLTSELRGGVLYRHGQVDGYRLSLAAARAVERLGGRVLLREVTGLKRSRKKVVGVEYRGGEVRCETVVLAMGAWASAAQKWLDVRIPVRPLHGEVLHMQLPGPPLELFILTARHGPILPRGDGVLLVGSIGGVSMSGMDVEKAHTFDPDEADPLEFDLEPKKENRDTMIDCALRIMPALGDADLVGHLAGVRPMSPDRLPIIGPAGVEGVFVATGHGTKGIHLAPSTGQIVADLVLRGQTEVPVPVEAFLPERFA